MYGRGRDITILTEVESEQFSYELWKYIAPRKVNPRTSGGKML